MGRETTFVPPVVSRWYRFDWQYAVKASRAPSLRRATTVISLMPLIISISRSLFPSLTGEIPPSLWVVWAASVAYVLSLALVYLACPQFIREYLDFGQYAARRHSHRFIVWEFYNNLESLKGWETVAREVSSKGLTIVASRLPRRLREALAPRFEVQAGSALKVLQPVNVDRDIYLPICSDGRELVLAMEEDDPRLGQKEKELFWILYSQATKERPFLRMTYWLLIGLSVLLTSLGVALDILAVVNYLAPQALVAFRLDALYFSLVFHCLAFP